MNASPHIERLSFNPPIGMRSPHIQTAMACIFPAGSPPPSSSFLVQLEDGDTLRAEISTPSFWKPTHKTILLLHGLGGSSASNYMIRLSRKLYQQGYRTVRLNLRSCGTGGELSRLPYHGGLSEDLLVYLKELKKIEPESPITIAGFSLGGNIVLKLTGELGEEASHYIQSTLAICPPIDLGQTAHSLTKHGNRFYNQYYVRQLTSHAKRWIQGKKFSSIYEFDNLVTATQWGFKSADEYYSRSSSHSVLHQIRIPCQILFSDDDPFINYSSCLNISLDQKVKISITEKGGHMGFLAWTDKNHGYFWLDRLMLKWIQET